MEQKIHLKYYNPELNIALADWRIVYLLSPKIVQLYPEVYKGLLVFRAKGSSKRYGYVQLKKSLIKKNIVITEDFPLLPF
jgi:hypothetical protein